MVNQTVPYLTKESNVAGLDLAVATPAVIETQSVGNGNSVNFRDFAPSGETVEVYVIGVHPSGLSSVAGLKARVIDEDGNELLAETETKRKTGSPLVEVSGAVDVRFELDNQSGNTQTASAKFIYAVTGSSSGDTGGTDEWKTDDDGAEPGVTIASSPKVTIEHDGSATVSNLFPTAYRANELDSTFEITFHDCTFTQDDVENNLAMGATVRNTPRIFDFDNEKAIAYQPQTESRTTDALVINDGSTETITDLSSNVDWSSAHSITVGFDGTDGYLEVDGNERARSSDAVSGNYRGAIELEDDKDTSTGDTVTVDSYTE